MEWAVAILGTTLSSGLCDSKREGSVCQRSRGGPPSLLGSGRGACTLCSITAASPLAPGAERRECPNAGVPLIANCQALALALLEGAFGFGRVSL